MILPLRLWEPDSLKTSETSALASVLARELATKFTSEDTRESSIRKMLAREIKE